MVTDIDRMLLGAIREGGTEAAIAAWEAVARRRVGVTAHLLDMRDKGLVHLVTSTGEEIDGRRTESVRRVLCITELGEGVLAETSDLPKSVEATSDVDPRSIFVVHGRNLALRDSMAKFLRALDLHPLEWSSLVEKSQQGSPHIDELLDLGLAQSKASVVLISPDEEVRLSIGAGASEAGWQARPNVYFEAGMALARAPSQVVLVQCGEVRGFSDVSGRHYVNLTDKVGEKNVGARQDLARRLQSIGCLVDTSGTDWLAAGDFLV